jgi:hypothetical protein
MAHAAVRRKLTKEPRSDVCCPGCHVITPTFTDPPGRQLLERPFQLRDKTTIADIVFMHTTLDWTIRHGFLGPHPVRKSASLGGNTRNARWLFCRWRPADVAATVPYTDHAALCVWPAAPSHDILPSTDDVAAPNARFGVICVPSPTNNRCIGTRWERSPDSLLWHFRVGRVSSRWGERAGLFSSGRFSAAMGLRALPHTALVTVHALALSIVRSGAIENHRGDLVRPQSSLTLHESSCSTLLAGTSM